MPALTCPKREAYCQGRAKGLSQVDAYCQAGFSEKTAEKNAYKLEQKPEIQERIEELKAPALQEAELDIASWAKELAKLVYAELGDENVSTAEKLKAIEVAGRYMGLFKDRIQIDGLEHLKKRSDEELDDIITELVTKHPDLAGFFEGPATESLDGGDFTGTPAPTKH